jgi:hypothetical protein
MHKTEERIGWLERLLRLNRMLDKRAGINKDWKEQCIIMQRFLRLNGILNYSYCTEFWLTAVALQAEHKTVWLWHVSQCWLTNSCSGSWGRAERDTTVALQAEYKTVWLWRVSQCLMTKLMQWLLRMCKHDTAVALQAEHKTVWLWRVSKCWMTKWLQWFLRLYGKLTESAVSLEFDKHTGFWEIF